MTLLAPLFLAGLLALAVPILIHLTHRERKQPIVFPSLMFLRKVPFRTTRRQRIRNWPLFLLRAAVIILVVAAFARPFVEGAAIGAVDGGTARDVVLILDRSASMGYGDRWTRALDAARAVIDGLGPDDQLTLVAFSDRPELLIRATRDREALHTVIDALRPEAVTTRFAPALRLARDLLDQSDYPHREAVLVTDFQRIGWDGRSDVRLPDGVRVTHVDLSDREPQNLAVTDVLLDRSPEDGGRATVSARIANTGGEPASGVTVELEIDGRIVQTRTAEVDAGTTALVRFGTVAIPAVPTRARVRVAPDRLRTDDAFHFLLRPIPAIPVLLVEQPNAPGTETVYLRRALEIGRDPTFDVRVRRTSRLGNDDLADRAVVVLNDVPFPGGASGRRLVQFVEQGGGLLVILGRRGGTLSAALRDSAGGPTGAPVDRLGDRGGGGGGGGTMSIADYTHPVFQPFSTPRSGDFSAARFFRYRHLTDPPAGRVLARLDDGGAALTETQLGRGTLMLWASGLANVWNDLPLQPVFLPFVHQLIRYLAGFAEPPAWYTAGQVFDLADLDQRAGTELVIEAPSGARSAETVTGESRHIQLREAGFYLIRRLGGPVSDAAAVAVNADPAESDLTPLDPEELLAGFRPLEQTRTMAAAELSQLTPVELERRQRLWWYLLLGGLVILAVESLAAGRASRAAA